MALASPTPTLVIREYADSDHAVILLIWQRGVLEMAPLLADYLRARSHVAAAVALAVSVALASPLLAITTIIFYVFMLSPAWPALASAALWRLILALSSGTSDMACPANLRAKWCVPGVSAFFVGELDGLPVGCVSVRMAHTLDEERVPGAAAMKGHASLWRLSVDAAVRRSPMRVGHALCDAAHVWAARHGAARISLVCGNPESIKFYRRIGYASEALDIAREAVFGSTAPGWAHWWRAYFLPQRTHVEKGSILAKELPPVTSR